jgi:hypothetical protein
MRRLLTTLLLLSLAAVSAHARQQPAPVGRLIDEFGEIQFSDLMARLDNFAIDLQNDPSARGLVVAYPARHRFLGWPLRRAETALAYLTSTRGLEASRLAVVNGGMRGETTFQLWLVPAGAETPVKPFDVPFLMAGEKAAVPFDRFAVRERGENLAVDYYEGEGMPRVDSAKLYAYFAEVLRRDPSLRGCIIGYTWRRGTGAAARRIASRAKLTIAKAHAIDVSRVIALGGGRRDYKIVELWLVPPGAALPKPAPAPTARKARRKSNR